MGRDGEDSSQCPQPKVTVGGRPEPDLIGFGGRGDFSCLVLQYGSLPGHVGYFAQFTRVEGGELQSRGVWALLEGGTGGPPDSAGEGCSAGPRLHPWKWVRAAFPHCGLPRLAVGCTWGAGLRSLVLGVHPLLVTVTCPVQAQLSLPHWALGVAVPWRVAEVSVCLPLGPAVMPIVCFWAVCPPWDTGSKS